MNNNPNQDANLLHFLKNQSLFNQSPTRRMSSRSRDRKSERNRSPGQGQVNGNYSYNVTTGYNNQGSPINIQDNNRNITTTYQTNTSAIQAQPQMANVTYTTTNNGYGVQGQGQIQGNLQGNVQGNYVTTTTETNRLNEGMLSTAAGLVQNLVTYSSSF